MERRNAPARTYLDPALSLVEFSVRTSPTLARLLRKCATLEAGGTPAHDALLASAGLRAGEVEALRAQAKQSAGELEQALNREARLRLDLDHANAAIALRDAELADIRRILHKTAEMEKDGRQSVEALDRQITELGLAVAALEERLSCTMSTDELDERALTALGKLGDRLARGEEIGEVALDIADCNPLDVQTAMANQDRQEMRAFATLLEGSSWRQRLVLWLLGATKAR